MARTKKGSKKAGTKKSGKKPASRPLAKHASGNHAKVRHMRDRRGHLHVFDGRLPTGLVAKPVLAQPKSKHRSYFEFVENTEKKKKLEFTVTKDIEPPPGYEFVPIGNPELTAACKELSREQEAMIFIVSTYSDRNGVVDGVAGLKVALNRVGHHIRERIVEQARESLGEMEDLPQQACLDVPEPIPEDQEEINKQADAAIRDLFPRIPNTDRQIIIEHSFKMGAKAADGMPLVGLAADLTLSRRVQLAVISHIRHTHTRYDQLLRETTWANARRAVEELCLDILVKWRGDEESGRDQLDEILREVVVISDSEDDYEDDEDDDEEDDEDADVEDTDMTSGESSDETAASTGDRPSVAEHAAFASDPRPHPHPAAAVAGPSFIPEPTEAERARAAAKRAHRGFQRYQAVRDQAWQQALSRQRQGHDHAPSDSWAEAGNRPESRAFQRRPGPEAYYQTYGSDRGDGDSAGPSDYRAREGRPADAWYRSGAPHDAHLPSAYRIRLDHVSAPRPRPPLYYYDKGEGYRNGDSGGKAYQPVVGSHSALRPSPGAHTVVSCPAPEDLKDYLVPSIEPASPLASKFSAQSLEERRLDPSSEHWQSRPALHQGIAEPGYASLQVPDEGFIRVYRQAGTPRRTDPLPPHSYSTPGAVGPSDSGLARQEVREQVMHHPVTETNAGYHHVHPDLLSRNAHISGYGTYIRQDDRRFTLPGDRGAAFDNATEDRWRPAVPVDGGGVARPRGAARPVVVEDKRTWGEPYRSYAVPAPDDGSNASYREASRPIVVEDEHTWKDPYRPQPAPLRVEEPGALLARRPVLGKPEEHDGWSSRRADRYTMPTEDSRRPPLGFIPVSNMFPRPHAARRNEAPAYIEAYPGGAVPMDGPATAPSRNAHYQHLQSGLDPQDNVSRQERIVRYEFVEHGRVNQEQAQRVHDHREIYRPQGPLTAGVAPGAYGVPPATRPSRQDGAIYIE